MEQLVFIHDMANEPYTTSDIVSEYSGVNRRRVTDLIRKYRNDFLELGGLTFETSKPIAGSKGGRPHKIYQLNEAHITFLFGLLDNTPKVVDFNLLISKAFMKMKERIAEQAKEISKKDVMLERNRKTNKDLGEVIKQYIPDNPHAYTNFHTLAYKVVVGMTPAQFKQAKHVEHAQNGLDADQLDHMERIRNLMAGLIELGKTYHEVRAIVYPG